MKESLFKLSYFLNHDEKFHLARVNITSSHDISYHTHNYAELAWVERGEGFHYINRQKVKLSKGDIIMIRPNDKHTFASTKKGITITNIAFEKQTLDIFRERYFENCDLYFWVKSYLPFQIRLSLDVLNRISSRAEEAILHDKTNIQLDSLLLFIFRQIIESGDAANHSGLPLWLFAAIRKYNTPDMFLQGLAGFVTLCDRNVDYVNRIVKQYLDKTLTELINESKMKYAITQLAITSMSIKEICSNCGFKNMGHFYKVFKATYNQTPYEYRKLNQMIV